MPPREEDGWESGVSGKRHPAFAKKRERDTEKKATAAGDAPKKKKKGRDEAVNREPEHKDSKVQTEDDRKGGKGRSREQTVEDIEPTPSQIEREEAELRAMERRRQLRKKQWPEVTRVRIHTKPWTPPPPPERAPRVIIDYPPLKKSHWTPPFLREREKRPPLPRTNLGDAPPLPYETQLRKVWHNFQQVDTNKMMLRGTLACDSKRYLPHLAGAQTGCIALVCRALLDSKTPAQLNKQDVDDCIHAGDQYYRQCMKTMKCYKGKPALPLAKLIPSFYFRGHKYTVDLVQADQGVLAKSPENAQASDDLMGLMEKRAGTEYMGVLTVDGDTHFLIWGGPPSEPGHVTTVCYIFDPHMLDEWGSKYNLPGAGAFLRYPGVTSFVLDFIDNYGDLKAAKKAYPKPPITITTVEILDKQPIPEPPGYSLDLQMLKPHCKSEWEAINIQAMIDEKRNDHKWALASMSAESLAASRKSSRKKVNTFFQKGPKESPPPPPPVPPEKAPPAPSPEQIMALRGEDFFLYCPKVDSHLYGRDDMIEQLAKSETILHSPVDIADHNFQSQFQQIDDNKSILRATRHFASYRYQTFFWFHGIACCVAALGMLRRLRGRAWNEDTLDESLDCGWNFFRESLMERRGPVRRLVLGELKRTFKIRSGDYKHKERGIVVWGKVSRASPKVLEICRGLEHFFAECDTGILQIPGELETAIWYEGNRYFMYHPWPADKFGNRVGLQDGGKACLLSFTSIQALCDHFLENVQGWRRKPYSISDVRVYELGTRPEPVNDMKPIGPNRWALRGTHHEGDESFPEERRGKQATACAMAAIARAQLTDPATWTGEDIDEILSRGDILYEKTMTHLDKLGIDFETPTKRGDEEAEGEEEEEVPSGTTGTLAAADVLPRFRITDLDCIETDVYDSLYSGQLNAEPDSGVLSLKDSLKEMFKTYNAGVVTARGASVAVFKHDNHLYFFDPHGCDENGLPSEDNQAGAVLIRMTDDVKELADVIMGNLSPGNDDSFNLSPVEMFTAKLNPELGAPVIQKDTRAHEWLQRNTATILMGPRGENSAIGKAAGKAGIGSEDLAGRTLALPAAAAFCAAASDIPAPGMHQDHMFHFLDSGAEFYVDHVKKTGQKTIEVPDLQGGQFEMGANTFTIDIGEATKLPFRLPDPSAEGGGDEEGGGLGEGEEKPEVMKEMKEQLFKIWYDTTKPTSVHLLVGDYHTLGVWMSCEGKVVVFDPAPTLAKGALTMQRISKGDELRKQRLKDEMSGEAGEEEDEEGGEGEALPEPEPEFVPPEACPVLYTFASPAEFIDKFVQKGPLDNKQMITPYWLYPVSVSNELSKDLKERRPGAEAKGGEERAEADEGEEEGGLVEALDEEAIGKHFKRQSRTVASVRGAIRQDEQYFLENPNRDNQDCANAIMGIVIDSIEPYIHWKPALIDAALKYGDRLYTLSLSNAKSPPRVHAEEIATEFRVTNFNVKLEVTPDVVTGDIKAGDSGKPLNLARGIKKFFETEKYGVVCAKAYCVGVWRAQGEKGYVMWDPHGVGPIGKSGPESAAGCIVFSNVDELAETIKYNIEALDRALPNKFTIASVLPTWEFAKAPAAQTPPGATPDEGYEWKVLTAFVEFAKGRTILRGSRPHDLTTYTRDAVLSSSATAVVAACMTHVRQPHLWTRKTMDDIMQLGCCLFNKSINNLGYEFRPGEDILLPLQVLRRFRMGVNYIRYNLEAAYQGRLELKGHEGTHLRAALSAFFETHTHGILWCSPHAVAVWRVSGAPCYFMCDPHPLTPTGLRGTQDDVASAVMTFTSPKLMAYHYLQNYPLESRPNTEFVLYVMSVTVSAIPQLRNIPPLVKPQGGRDLVPATSKATKFVLYVMSVTVSAIPQLRNIPPLVKPQGGKDLVPATSKCTYDGKRRRADEGDRHHPPGSVTCLDIMHATELCDQVDAKLKGLRNANGWLVVSDGSMYLSAKHSMNCKKFPYASRGYQGLCCAIMAVAMSHIETPCRWCEDTLDRILDSGGQLYRDSWLHYRPDRTKYLTIEQVLRKFYTPGECVCRVCVYAPRQEGSVDEDITDQLSQFFREEQMGVFDAGDGRFAVALFKTVKGFYMFDPGDCDRYGRAVAPPCVGRGRACLSHYPKIRMLASKLQANIPPLLTGAGADAPGDGVSSVRFDSQPVRYKLYGMAVSSLRKLNEYEK